MAMPATPRASNTTAADFSSPGYYLDGWADLVEDRGSKAADIGNDFYQRLQARNMPDVKLTQGTVTLKNENRHYAITATYPGAQTLIYIDAYGSDLFVSWKTFIKPVINGATLAIIAAIAGVPSLYALIEMESFIVGLVIFLFLALTLAGIVATAGRFLKGSAVAYFFIEPTLFDAEDITAMGLAVHKTLLHALNNAGIKQDVLRLKRNFSGGRRGETI